MFKTIILLLTTFTLLLATESQKSEIQKPYTVDDAENTRNEALQQLRTSIDARDALSANRGEEALTDTPISKPENQKTSYQPISSKAIAQKSNAPLNPTEALIEKQAEANQGKPLITDPKPSDAQVKKCICSHKPVKTRTQKRKHTYPKTFLYYKRN